MPLQTPIGSKPPSVRSRSRKADRRRSSEFKQEEKTASPQRRGRSRYKQPRSSRQSKNRGSSCRRGRSHPEEKRSSRRSPVGHQRSRRSSRSRSTRGRPSTSSRCQRSPPKRQARSRSSVSPTILPESPPGSRACASIAMPPPPPVDLAPATQNKSAPLVPPVAVSMAQSTCPPPPPPPMATDDVHDAAADWLDAPPSPKGTRFQFNRITSETRPCLAKAPSPWLPGVLPSGSKWWRHALLAISVWLTLAPVLR